MHHKTNSKTRMAVHTHTYIHTYTYTHVFTKKYVLICYSYNTILECIYLNKVKVSKITKNEKQKLNKIKYRENEKRIGYLAEVQKDKKRMKLLHDSLSFL